MELYYNPDQMQPSEIKGTFVAREWLIDELLSVIKRQPAGAGVQHAVLIGPRGIGKTTVLLMLRLAVLENPLARRWMPVRFPEESYAIADAADLWLAVISHLAYESADPELAPTADALRREFKESAALGEAAVATLKDWSRKKKRRLLLLIDNLDMILEQINDETESSRLREVLMNDGTFMLVGAATSFFKQAREYDHALYNFFRTWNLDSLDSPQVDQLLRRRAAVDERADFDKRLQENEVRIRVLHYFTGGNPRLVLMLYRIIVSSDLVDVRRGLEKLLDEVTPYYKAKIESLPPQQRKILDHVARISGRTQEGLTPTQISEGTRLPVNQVSAQLKRLSDLGYVRAANLRSRNSYYSLAEPLYAIWHQMRFGRESRQRMEWLIEFLKGWYSSQELVEQLEELASKFQALIKGGEVKTAVGILEYRQYLAQAVDASFRGGAVDKLIVDCLEAGEIERARDVLQGMDLLTITEKTVDRLRERGLITSAQLKAREARMRSVLKEAQDAVVARESPLEILDRIRPLEPFFIQFPFLWVRRGAALQELGQWQEAKRDYSAALVTLEDARTRAVLLFVTGQYQRAVEVCNRLIKRDPKDSQTHKLHIRALASLGMFDEASSSTRRAALSGEAEVRTEVKRLEGLLSLKGKIPDPLLRLCFLLENDDFDGARALWNESAKSSEDVKSFAGFYALIRTFARPNNLGMLRGFLSKEQAAGLLAPLARALDYLITRDRTIVEKLSTEMRPIVDEIVEEYEKKHARKPEERPKSKPASVHVGRSRR